MPPRGAALFVPDNVTETFEPRTRHGGNDGNGRGLRYLEWVWDPDPSDTTVIADYGFLLREEGGTVRVEHDRHEVGLFPRGVWMESLEEAGFVDVERILFEHSEVEWGLELFLGRAPRT